MTLNEVADHLGREMRYEAVTEYVGIAAQGSNTHIDGLARYCWDGKNYIADPWQLSGLLPTEIQTSVVPLGKPTRQLTKLRRRSVEETVTHEQFEGAPFTRPAHD